MSCDFIRGIVVNEALGTPVGGLTVSATWSGSRPGQLLGNAVTQPDGRFAIDLDRASTGPLANDHYTLRVYQGRTELHTERPVRWSPNDPPGRDLVICVMLPEHSQPQEPAAPSDTVLWGIVRHEDGTPVERRELTPPQGVLVKLYAINPFDPNDDTFVDDVTTEVSGAGAFTGRYGFTTVAGTTRFILKVYEPGTPDRYLGQSKAYFNPSLSPALRVDIQICDDAYRQDCEFTRLDDVIDASGLVPGIFGAPPFDFSTVSVKTLAVLAGATRWELGKVTIWMIAKKIAQAWSAYNTIPIPVDEALYGLMRQGFPQTADGILARSRASVPPTLNAAATANIISRGVADDSSDVSDVLLAAYKGGLKATTRSDTLYQILTIHAPALTPTQANDFIDLYSTFTGNDAAFWDLVDGLSSFDAAAVEEAQRRIILGAIALSWAPAVSEILDVIGAATAYALAGALGAIPRTAGAGLDSWQTIAEGTSPLPGGLIGNTTAERQTYLADLMYAHATLAYPSAHAKAKILEYSTLGPIAEVQNYLAADPEFDFKTSIVISGVGAEAEDAARGAQRLLRVLPATVEISALETLMDDGVMSAHAITKMGPTRFYARYGTALTRAVAEATYRRAQSLTSMTRVFLTQANPKLTGQDFRFLPRNDTDSTALDDFEELFGNLDYCACEECRSVLSPAAYLVDLMKWLEDRPTQSGTSGLDVLLARRGDLADMELSCENTTTAMPYIDLALEALEDYVASSGTVSAHSTTATTPELLAAPEYVNSTAYTTLSTTAKQTVHVPFVRSVEEARAFLGHLGIDRTDLMRTFEGMGGFLANALPVPDCNLEDIAREELRLNEAYWTSINDTSATEADYWPEGTINLGTVKTFMRSAEVDYPTVLDLLHARFAQPADGTLEISKGTDPCDFDEYSIVVNDGPPPHRALTASDVKPLRALIRLRRATGWSALDLDKVLFGMGIESQADMTDAFLQELGHLHHVTRMTGLTPVEVVTWLDTGKMDVFEDRDSSDHPVPTLWSTRILNASLFTLEERTSGPFVYNVMSGDLLGAGTETLASQAEKLQAVLGIGAADISALYGVVTGGSTAALTLANVSLLFRWTSIADAAGLTIADAVALADLVGSPGDPTGSFAGAVRFLEDATLWREAGWSTDEIRYVVNHEATERVAVTDAFVRDTLGRLRDTLNGLYNALPDDSTDDALRDAVWRKVAELFGLDKAVGSEWRSLTWSRIPAPTSSPDAAELDFTFGQSRTLTQTGGAFPATVPTVGLPTSTSVTYNSTAYTLSASVQGTGEVDVIAANGTSIAAVRGDRWRRSVANTALAEDETYALASSTTATLDGAATLTLASDVTASPSNLPAGAVVTVATATAVTIASGEAITVGGDIAFVTPSDLETDPIFRLFRNAFWEDPGSGTDPYSDLDRGDAQYENDFQAIDVLAKAAFLLGKFGLDAEERAFWVAQASTWDLLAPQVVDVATITSGYELLRATALLFAQRVRLPGASPTAATILTTISTSADPAVVAKECSDRTAWDESMLDALIGGFVEFGSSGPSLRSAGGFKRFLDAVALVRTAGSDANIVASWRVPPNATSMDDVSPTVVTAVRSRYANPSAWSKVARPIRDILRKKQRDALVSYILATLNAAASEAGKLKDADALYEYLLIDVSMNPEMLTARIKQAACTVQLFIHRCMLGLERDATDPNDPLLDLNDDDRAQWEWMRTYRVWEAARKVFLYPENWIEAELRDDKTKLYKILEQDIAQGDVTADRVEQSMLDYLDSLHAISSLRVLAYYVQMETVDGEEIDKLHVFACDRGEPATYWYRRREDSAYWTPWEKVDAGVQGIHLVPVVYNRRLLLFWVEFQQTGTQASDAASDDQAFYYLVRLGMTEYRDGKWSPKKYASETFPAGGTSYRTVDSLPDPKQFMFVSWTNDDGQLVITSGARPRVDSTTGALENKISLNGSWVINTCTFDFALDGEVGGERVTSRHGSPGTNWLAPGYRDESPNPSLSAYIGPVDPVTNEGDRADADWVELLATLPAATVIVPCQYRDFVSQTPFFVNWNERAYFVEKLPAAPPNVPSVGLLGAYRDGTHTPVDEENPEGSPPAEPPADVPFYLDAGMYPSDGVMMSVITSAYLGWTGSDDKDELTATSDVFRFSLFYHPYVCDFISEVRRAGVFGLLDPDPDSDARRELDLFRQQMNVDDFDGLFDPTSHVATPYPKLEVDFSYSGSYSQYNWELFVHIPLYVALRLADNQQYAAALRWFHCMFDPRTRYALPAAYTPPAGDPDSGVWWKVKPFLEPISAPVTNWIAFTTGASADAFEKQVAAWQDDPFNPHLLARLRPGTYQKTIAMKYIETLIAWGDALFTRDTIETINEAAQLYVFAKHVLGDRPQRLDPTSAVAVKTFSDLRADLDAFGNATVRLENDFRSDVSGYGCGRGSDGSATSGAGYTSYFCVPVNPKLLGYWDLVADRLFKIRNGLNIRGVARTLALYEPPIDPALLVRAAAAGINIGTAADGVLQALPNHRFSVILGKAQMLCNSARALGQALLSALEKKDAEALSVLRQGHEIALLEAARFIKEKAIEEAQDNLDAVTAQIATTTGRRDYYVGLIAANWTREEKQAATLNGAAAVLDASAAIGMSLSAVLSVVPEIEIGFPCNGMTTGGENASRPGAKFASAMNITSGAAKSTAQWLSVTSGYKRRKEEWEFQKAQGDLELAQLDKQSLAAEIRLDMANRELRNHELQMKQSSEVNDYLTSKFTNADLYQWMAGQLSASYFQAYQLAVSYAKKAEQCYQHELGRTTDTFISAAYWDSARKGLLAADQLSADLDRMDASYLDNDIREFELTKHIDLSKLDPVALQILKTDGECYFEVPEGWFDIDCPGHYFRRMQSIALSIADVTGERGMVNAQLTLENHRLRRTTAAVEEWLGGNGESIVTSVSVNDGGVFNMDMRDPRYLPFERLGAISRWRLRLTAQKWKQFDWDSITEVTLHMKYTARDGGDAYRQAVEAKLAANLGAMGTGYTGDVAAAGVQVVISASRDLADIWYAAKQSGTGTLDIDLANYLPEMPGMEVKKVAVIGVDYTFDSSARARIHVATDHDSVGVATIGQGVQYFEVPNGASMAADSEDTLQVKLFTDSFVTQIPWTSFTDVILVLFMQKS